MRAVDVGCSLFLFPVFLALEPGRLTEPATKGFHRMSWNLRDPAPMLARPRDKSRQGASKLALSRNTHRAGISPKAGASSRTSKRRAANRYRYMGRSTVMHRCVIAL